MIVVVGLSFRTAPVEVRERFATSNDALPQVLARLAARPELAEVMFLSTCNRVEVFARPKTGTESDRALALRAGCIISSNHICDRVRDIVAPAGARVKHRRRAGRQPCRGRA